MAGLPESFIDKVRNSVDIVDIVSNYVELERSGKSYKGLCPFHQEKTPSFFVNPENQLYYCFGCSAGGNVFNFLMEVERFTFLETIKMLADDVGLEMPDNQNSFSNSKNKKRDRIFAVNNLSAKFYHYLLTEKDIGKKALSYLEKRGFDREDIKNYYLGFAPDRWRILYKFLKERNFTDREMLKAGLVSSAKNDRIYDRFRGRIIFPIYNNRGEVLAFGARIIEKEKNAPKYLNSPETIIFKKGENLYGLNWARDTIRKKDQVIVMEGYTDVLTAHKYGITNAVASLGTAFTVKQAALLDRYCSKVYIAYDADTAGASATLKGLDIINNYGLEVKVIRLSQDMDPDQFIREKGREVFDKIRDEALSLVEFKVKMILKRIDFNEVEGKIEFTKEVGVLLADFDNEIERELYMNDLSQRYEVEKKLLEQSVIQALNKKSKYKKKDKKYNSRYTKNDNETKPTSNINTIELIYIISYLEYKEHREILGEYMYPEYFSSRNKKIIEVIQKNPDISLQDMLDEIDDSELKKKYMAVSVRGTKLQLNAEALVNKFVQNLKLGIYRILNNNQSISLKRLNRLFVYFKHFSLY